MTAQSRRRPQAPIWVTVGIIALLVSSALIAFADDTQARKAPAFAGRDLCIACHADVTPVQAKDWHNRLIMQRPGSKNCEECHGPSQAHSEDPIETATFYRPKTAPATKSGALCMRCHQQKVRSATWRTCDHARAGVRCWDCHSEGATPHSKTVREPDTAVCLSCHREQASTFSLTSHHPVREGRVGCSDCHAPHRRQSARDMQAKCLSCHATQRGPFVFAHGSISGGLTDGCLDCHRPHGSPNTKMLKFTGRGLCLQCHADRALHFAPRTCWTSGCHARVHGSNTSPLLLGR